MNQEKIGKLIAKLRKEKGLTQQELGDMVGVGYRAVSKWETGSTLPDISIINDLSKILGITSDELLKGELNKKNIVKKQFNKKYLLLLIPVVMIIVLLAIFINNNKKASTYLLKTNSDDCYVEGSLSYKNHNLSVYINKLTFSDYELLKMRIINYQYKIVLDDDILFGYGYNGEKALKAPISVEQITQDFNVDCDAPNVQFNTNNLEDNKLYLELLLIQEDDEIISKNIRLIIYE